MRRPKIVLLGMLTKIPVGGVAWLVRHYAIGFERLGFEPFYVEAHGRTPSMLMEQPTDDPTALAVRYLEREMRQAGMAGRWAFHALHDDGAVHGMSPDALRSLYRDAALIINFHGGTVPREEHASSGRLVYLGTDPVDLELELDRGEQSAIDFLAQHCAFFTWGMNYGGRTCQLPYDARFPAIPSPPPVVVDLWEGADGGGGSFTTVGNWRQDWRDVRFRGEVYRWSKHHEFLRVLDLPARTGSAFELALSSLPPGDRDRLEAQGWSVRSGMDVSRDPERYRDYIRTSRGEFTVAKDQNVRLRTGWFSERSATYLAAGRPVVTQDTGFGTAIPTGRGVLAFSDLDEAVEAIEEVERNYGLHRRAALDVARGYFAHDVVLGALLDHVGIRVPRRHRRFGVGGAPIATDAVLEPLERRPLRLASATVEHAMSQPVPVGRPVLERPVASIVMVTYDNLLCTRLAIESVLANTEPAFEVIVVDNASADATSEYLELLERRNPSVRVIRNDRNEGFAAANNQALAIATAPVLVLLNNDTIVPPEWLPGLLSHLEVDDVGAVGPVTNRICNEAEIPTSYRTYAGMIDFARRRSTDRRGDRRDISMLAMFCFAMRRETFERVGPLDERFGTGTLEDADYSRRVRDAGLRLVCAEDVFVHHFSQASFAELITSGAYAELRAANTALFEDKWETAWAGYARREDADYERLRAAVRDVVAGALPPGTTVAVITKGDDELVELDGRHGVHFPTDGDGGFAGFYPANGAEALVALERVRVLGATHLVVPATASWWLDFYPELAARLAPEQVTATDACSIYRLGDDRS